MKEEKWMVYKGVPPTSERMPAHKEKEALGTDRSMQSHRGFDWQEAAVHGVPGEASGHRS